MELRNRMMIKKPVVSAVKGHSRLSADTVWMYDGQTIEKEIFFEVEEKWGKYLVAERSDAFVLALLELAMEKNCDIEYEAPMTETLKYQLEKYLIAVYARKIQGFYAIKLIGPMTNEEIFSEGVAGTGFSAGVDSFYSVLSHLNSEYPSKKVTHLLLAVNGAALTGMTEELDQEWFQEEMTRFTPIAEELGTELIGVNSNISQITQFKNILKGGDSVVTSSFVHALRKLFGTYYWASAYEADVIGFVTSAPGYMEPFNVPLLSVEGLRFYHSGCEVSRVEKVEYIADNPLVQKALTVCGEPVSCGHCYKCLRTMAELYSIQKLDKFSGIFDIEKYKKHFSSKLARELALDHPPFTTDIVKSMKKHGVPIPISVYIRKELVYKPYFFLKKKLRNNHFLMHLYYEKGWSVKMGEGKKHEGFIAARMAGKDKE